MRNKGKGYQVMHVCHQLSWIYIQRKWREIRAGKIGLNTVTQYCHQSIHCHWWQDSLDRCLMPINADKCRSKFWPWSQCLSILINADQCRSIPTNSSQCRSALRDIERHFGSMPCFWSALIGIDRHWALIGGVLWWMLFYHWFIKMDPAAMGECSYLGITRTSASLKQGQWWFYFPQFSPCVFKTLYLNNISQSELKCSDPI